MAQSAGSSGSAPASAVSVVRKDSSDDIVSIRRSLLKSVLDTVERSAAAAAHAVKISTAARTAFEEEHKRLLECTRDLSRFVDKPEL